jgi:hypothetical protein
VRGKRALCDNLHSGIGGLSVSFSYRLTAQFMPWIMGLNPNDGRMGLNLLNFYLQAMIKKK